LSSHFSISCWFLPAARKDAFCQIAISYLHHSLSVYELEFCCRKCSPFSPLFIYSLIPSRQFRGYHNPSLPLFLLWLKLFQICLVIALHADFSVSWMSPYHSVIYF
jgi:hypothetical protein